VSIRSLLIVVLALVFGGSVAFGINTVLKKRADQAATPDTVPVVVTTEEVGRFASLSEDMLQVRQFPKDLAPPGCMPSIAEAANRVTFVTLAKGEPVSSAKISAKGAGKGMGAAIPKGMRAFTINTPTVASHVAGFILPGSRVDVLLTVKTHGAADDATGGASTTTLQQNLEILAVDQRLEPSNSKVDNKELRSVTLLVTPDQAAKLDLGQNAGTLHLCLRNPEDPSEAKTRPATLADLRFLQEKPRPKDNDQAKSNEGDDPSTSAAAAARKARPAALVRTIRGVENHFVEIR
jgi:pilus assembly protein CpaB